MSSNLITSDEIQFMCLGPTGAGKRTMLTALGIEAAKSNPNVAVPRNHYLLRDTASMVEPDSFGWLMATAVSELNPRTFLYEASSKYADASKTMKFNTFNYAPEYTGEIATVLKNDVNNTNIEDSRLKKIVEEIKKSVKIIAIIDCNRFKSDENLSLGETIKIIENISAKNVIPVATKTDIFIPEYESKPGYNGDINQNKIGFKKLVHFELKSNSQYKKLLDLTEYKSCFPVHFKTKEHEITGERFPKSPLEIHGFQAVLEELAK